MLIGSFDLTTFLRCLLLFVAFHCFSSILCGVSLILDSSLSSSDFILCFSESSLMCRCSLILFHLFQRFSLIYFLHLDVQFIWFAVQKVLILLRCLRCETLEDRVLRGAVSTSLIVLRCLRCGTLEHCMFAWLFGFGLRRQEFGRARGWREGGGGGGEMKKQNLHQRDEEKSAKMAPTRTQDRSQDDPEPPNPSQKGANADFGIYPKRMNRYVPEHEQAFKTL